MADIISRLKLESGEFDSKVKRATQGLLAMEQECRKVGGTLGILEKDQKQYVQALGSMQTVSTTTRGKIAELTQAYTELAMQYRRLTDEEKKGDFGKALTSSLDQLKARLRDTKSQLAEVNEELNESKEISEGLFDSDKLGGMLQVFGGNLMTKGFMMATDAVMGFVDKVKEAAEQGIEMAKSGEGIERAFQRLNNPDLLQNLRDATHNTVNDLELMKAAVQFNDFRLPLNELGTMLAFAQQKARETGQSVDYLVSSIVTGLGRQSVMILDNLGLSATEIRERMKETGDMTAAVGDIIRDKMAASGEYIETAADRAAQAQVKLDNAMKRLGETLLPLEEQGVDVFTAIEIAALDMLNNGMKPVVPVVTELKEGLDDLAGAISSNAVINGFTNWFSKALDTITRLIPVVGQLKRMMDEGEAGRGLLAGAKAGIFTLPEKPAAGGGGGDGDGSGGGGGSHTATAPAALMQAAEDSIRAQRDRVKELTTAYELAGAASRKYYKEQLDLAKEVLDAMEGKGKTIDPIAELEKQFIEPKITLSGSGDIFGQVISDMQAQAEQADYTAVAALVKEGLTAGFDSANMKELAQRLMAYLSNPGEASTEDVVAFVNEYKEILETVIGEQEWPKVKIAIETGDIPTIRKNLSGLNKDSKDMSASWREAGTAIQRVGMAMNQMEDPMIKVIGTIAQAVATMALSYAQAAASPAVTSTGWGWIAFAATGLATMLSSVAAIKGTVSGFAEGGIVPGNNHSMDNLNGPSFGINSGELILNKAQQGNLASQLEGGNGGKFYIEGLVEAEAIRLVMIDLADRTGNEALRAAMG